jgi:phosphoesterase RecJ-like protein
MPMSKQMNFIKEFQARIKKAKNIVISTHLFPDADGIGAQIALCLALNQIGVKTICVNEEPLLERYRYLDLKNSVLGLDEYLKSAHSKLPIDLFIIVDTNALPRIGNRMHELVKKAKDFLFIDHHPCPPEVKAIHCIDTNMSATGELVGTLIDGLGIKLTPEMALPLYTAIIIDTSSFRYPTVTGNTHRLVGKLMDTGIKPPAAYNQIYGSKNISRTQLLGQVLATAQTNEREDIAWLTLTENLLKKFDVDPEDTHAFINHLLILDTIKVACMFREQGSNIKISLRSSGEIDVGILAQGLGGGGHNHSAATIVEGKMNSVVKQTIMKLELMLGQKK